MRDRLRRQGPVLAAVAAGGVLGAEGRHALSLLQTDGSGWPWATFAINVSGCLLIGALMAVVLELTAPHRLIRPFLGIGLLGGYTTFSTYAADVRQLLADERFAPALSYLIGTPLTALVAVWGGATVARAALRRVRPAAGERAAAPELSPEQT